MWGSIDVVCLAIRNIDTVIANIDLSGSVRINLAILIIP
jgi:hypothetical protein